MASKRERVVISIADNVGDIKEVKTGSLLQTIAANCCVVSRVGVSTVFGLGEI